MAPVTSDCNQDDRGALIARLAPNRRVEIVVTGHNRSACQDVRQSSSLHVRLQYALIAD
jgi:hypothetical protein